MLGRAVVAVGAVVGDATVALGGTVVALGAAELQPTINNATRTAPLSATNILCSPEILLLKKFAPFYHKSRVNVL